MCSSTCPRRGSARCLARLRACFSQEARYSFTRMCGNARVLAPLLDLIARMSLAIERVGLADLTIEKLRKTDHLNPLMSRAHLDEVAEAAGFTIQRFRYYTPLLSSIAENILVPVAAHAMARRVARATPGSTGGRSSPPCERRESLRNSGSRNGGWSYRALQMHTRVVMLDVALFGRVRSGPFFALLVKSG